MNETSASFLNAEQAAQFLGGLNSRTVTRWSREGYLPAYPLGDTKTECSRRPVPLHPLVLESLLDWKRQSLYKSDGDFLFPSIRLNGTKPLSPDSLLKKAIRPALIRAGIEGKIIG